MKCANCDAPSLWTYDTPASDPVSFCDAHLPRFLRDQAAAGLLKTTEHHAEVAAEVAAVLAPEPEEPVEAEVAEEPAAEEVAVVEEAVASPTVKRARKKSEPSEPAEDESEA